jgi:succinate dehydrogenase / fumarate reductase cytochrome b subunit
MSWLTRSLNSSLGLKLLMALTGIVLFGFVLAHLTGNLLIFAGPDAVNGYAQKLRDLGALLWAARLFLLAVVGVHIVAAVKLALRNRSARPEAYARREPVKSTAAARSMMLTGATLAAYVVFHLAHFTWGYVLHDYHGRMDAQGRHDVYFMLVQGFREGWLVAIYAAALVVLGFHLSHGVSSFFQTLGWNHPRYNRFLHALGPVLAMLVVAGYLSIPLAVLTRLVSLEGAAS